MHENDEKGSSEDLGCVETEATNAVNNEPEKMDSDEAEADVQIEETCWPDDATAVCIIADSENHAKNDKVNQAAVHIAKDDVFEVLRSDRTSPPRKNFIAEEIAMQPQPKTPTAETYLSTLSFHEPSSKTDEFQDFKPFLPEPYCLDDQFSGYKSRDMVGNTESNGFIDEIHNPRSLTINDSYEEDVNGSVLGNMATTLSESPVCVERFKRNNLDYFPVPKNADIDAPDVLRAPSLQPDIGLHFSQLLAYNSQIPAPLNVYVSSEISKHPHISNLPPSSDLSTQTENVYKPEHFASQIPPLGCSGSIQSSSPAAGTHWDTVTRPCEDYDHKDSRPLKHFESQNNVTRSEAHKPNEVSRDQHASAEYMRGKRKNETGGYRHSYALNRRGKTRSRRRDFDRESSDSSETSSSGEELSDQSSCHKRACRSTRKKRKLRRVHHTTRNSSVTIENVLRRPRLPPPYCS